MPVVASLERWLWAWRPLRVGRHAVRLCRAVRSWSGRGQHVAEELRNLRRVTGTQRLTRLQHSGRSGSNAAGGGLHAGQHHATRRGDRQFAVVAYPGGAHHVVAFGCQALANELHAIGELGDGQHVFEVAVLGGIELHPLGVGLGSFERRQAQRRHQERWRRIG